MQALSKEKTAVLELSRETLQSLTDAQLGAMVRTSIISGLSLKVALTQSLTNEWFPRHPIVASLETLTGR